MECHLFFDQIDSVLNILEKLQKYLKFFSKKPETISSRFIELFESHGVHRNQIPKFFGHGLTIKDVQDEDNLIEKLNDEILDDACKLFAVKREWLDGAQLEVYEAHDFYKYPGEFLTFIDELKLANPEVHFSGELYATLDKYSYAEAFIVIREPIGYIGDNPIERYHLCGTWSFSYWKSRGYLAACVALAFRRGIVLHGIFAKQKDIKKIATGEVLLPSKSGLTKLYGKRWYPDDMATDPDVYLNGVDPEYRKFGITSALKLWLSLYEQGFMKIKHHENPQPLFQEKLNKLIS